MRNLLLLSALLTTFALCAQSRDLGTPASPGKGVTPIGAPTLSGAGALLGMAYLLAADLPAEATSKAEGKTAEAIGYVEQAIGKGATFEQLEKDEDLRGCF